ncbi:MAG: hypothetical protein ACI8ZB_001314 [Desulforhopalus sp.]|jgi:hypothetical protein
MKHVTNNKLSPGMALVIINIPPYGRVKLGDDKKTAFPELNTIITEFYQRVGSAPEDGFPSVNVANLLVEKFDGEITLVEYPDTAGIVTEVFRGQ